jgi:hypothetical protein
MVMEFVKEVANKERSWMLMIEVAMPKTLDTRLLRVRRGVRRPAS